MTIESPLHLWSFQAIAACEVLEKNGILRTDWDFTPVNWDLAYLWMQKEMEQRGIAVEGFAPIWAWHSCEGTWCAPPTIATARALLSDLQIMDGMCVVEFEAPAELCVLSSYRRFNALLDVVLDGETPDREAFLDMFNVPPIEEHDDIQAVLPYLKMEWVMDIRHLDLKPDRWDYDWKKTV